MVTHENTLSERERRVLSALASNGDAATARRAHALVEWSQGTPLDKIAQATGLRAAHVRNLTRRFSQKRLEVFSPSSVERASRGWAGTADVPHLLEKNQTDVAHSQYVAGLAERIFDETGASHQLGPEWLNILRTGALLHNLGDAEHSERQHETIKEAVLAHDLEGFTARDRDVLACLALFQRKKPKAGRDPIFTALDGETQKATLILAAILRVADGLDYTRTQTTRILAIQANATTDVVVEGPNAETDASRANKRADLWRETISPPFFARLADQSLPARTMRGKRRLHTGVASHEPIAKAGRKIIAAQFAKVQSLEDAVRSTDNVSAVHDMRVATRRMRSAFRLFSRYYPNKSTRRIRKPVRDLARLLGEVRDLDVMIENLRTFASTLTIEKQRALDPLLADWQARRAQAHRGLVEFLDSAEYDEWLDRLQDFTETKGPSKGPRVADVVPGLIWKRYGKVRQYERLVKSIDLATLHRLRIQGKRLRYALEFFSESTGGKGTILLEPLVALQDYLGELHDADMATQLVGEFVEARARRAERQGLAADYLEAVAGYLAYLRSRILELQAGFDDRWHVITKPAFRQGLADAVAEL